MTKSLFDFDIFFRSYDEPDADECYEFLKKRVPSLKRVHGVKGEFNAIQWAAKNSETDRFMTIDADTQWLDHFSFEMKDYEPGDERIHVWRSRNAVNGLVYGHGSVHLWNRDHILNIESFSGVDFTLGSATKGFVIQEECATTTRFNTSPFQSWRSGFKEGTKLASQTNLYPNSSYDYATSPARLKIWCSVGMDAEFGDFCILGARMGAVYGFKNKNNIEATNLLKDYDVFVRWWQEQQIPAHKKQLLANYRLNLARDYDFHVVDFDEEQSRYMKSVMYNVNRDVIDRLVGRNGPQINY